VEELSNQDVDLAVNFLVQRGASKIAESMDVEVLKMLFKRMNVPLEYLSRTHPYSLIREIVGYSHFQKKLGQNYNGPQHNH
jgi:hypothetical protein